MTTRVVLVMLGALLLVLLLAAPASAQPNPPLKCVVDMAVLPDFNPMESVWFGTISGDINGSIGFWEQGAAFPGKTQHFAETWTIWVDGDPAKAISGYDDGVWNFSTFEFRANGWVTAAVPAWQGLVGHKLFEIGTTSDPNLWPLSGGAAVFIAGP
jgi:hypothetical protein